MKVHFLLFGLMLSMMFVPASSQKIDGAWQSMNNGVKSLIAIKDGYFTHTEFSAKEFISSWGGTMYVKDKTMVISVEFNSANSENVGEKTRYTFHIQNNQLNIRKNGITYAFQKIDNGEAPLAGVWKISEREQEGKLVPINQKGVRKTLKLLTGSRFQWFAINPETKQFSGTGGGFYSFADGKYIENIDFFSRDNSRVGAQLVFDGKIESDAWHHSGLSSKGDTIYEVWKRIE